MATNKVEKVPFSKIKNGGFYRRGGKTLWQKFIGTRGQQVTGKGVGIVDLSLYPSTTVTSVNAKIVEEK